MVWKGKKADYEGFGKDVKKGLSKTNLLKKYNIKTETAYRTYLYRARSLGVLDKGKVLEQPIRKDKPEKARQPLKPVKPLQPSKPKKPRQPVKVHWEIPLDLLKRIKHKAIDQDKATVQIVREILERHI